MTYQNGEGIPICVGLRDPNKVSVFSSHLSHTAELFIQLCRATVLSIHLASAYHQVTLHPENWDFMVCITHEGFIFYKKFASHVIALVIINLLYMVFSKYSNPHCLVSDNWSQVTIIFGKILREYNIQLMHSSVYYIQANNSIMLWNTVSSQLLLDSPHGNQQLHHSCRTFVQPHMLPLVPILLNSFEVRNEC